MNKLLILSLLFLMSCAGDDGPKYDDGFMHVKCYYGSELVFEDKTKKFNLRVLTNEEDERAQQKGKVTFHRCIIES